MAKQKGITFKFIMPVFLITVIILAVQAIMIFNMAIKSESQLTAVFFKTMKSEQHKQEEHLREEFLKKGKSIADLMALSGANLIIGYDFDALQNLAQNGMSDADISGITFFGKDGKALTKEFKASGDQKTIKQEIKFDNESIGHVEVQVIFDGVVKQAKELSTRIAANIKQTAQLMNQTSRKLGLMILGGALSTILVLCLAIYLCLSRFVIKPVNSISRGLETGAGQVTAAAEELSAGSQQLANGASEQAASLEETSSSLEEVSSMTRQNAENASQCDQLMREVNQVVTTVSRTMTEQNGAMNEINRASEETAKIIKTIDEIAFQTNLLALNAAVEAARAGEAGAGFAVVADEVRNLAMRSAEAAKNTAELIEATVTKVKNGAELSKTANDNFSSMVEKTSKVGLLLEEIATASVEQTKGIGQVNSAVSEIDQVTQRAAANAESSASSAEQLSGLAEQMMNHVNVLMTLIKGGEKSISYEQDSNEYTKTDNLQLTGPETS